MTKKKARKRTQTNQIVIIKEKKRKRKQGEKKKSRRKLREINEDVSEKRNRYITDKCGSQKEKQT